MNFINKLLDSWRAGKKNLFDLLKKNKKIIMREIEHIVIHCADTKPDMEVDAARIKRWHLKRGWSDIGYHYIIKRNGTIEQGRDRDNDGNILEEIGAHVKGYNRNSIAICWVGGYDGIDNRTNEQKTSLETLIKLLHEIYPNARILGHKDFPGVSKNCPSFEVTDWLKEINLKNKII